MGRNTLLVALFASALSTALGATYNILYSKYLYLIFEIGQVAHVSTSPAQAINGIGASGAWWPNDLIKFPENIREQVAKQLFDSSPSAGGGAGLTSYRYNVGGGGVFVGTPS